MFLKIHNKYIALDSIESVTEIEYEELNKYRRFVVYFKSGNLSIFESYHMTDEELDRAHDNLIRELGINR